MKYLQKRKEIILKKIGEVTDDREATELKEELLELDTDIQTMNLLKTSKEEIEKSLSTLKDDYIKAVRNSVFKDDKESNPTPTGEKTMLESAKELGILK